MKTDDAGIKRLKQRIAKLGDKSAYFADINAAIDAWRKAEAKRSKP